MRSDESLIFKDHLFPKPFETEMRERDEASLNELRRDLARRLIELVDAKEAYGQTPRYMVSGEGYAVYRIGMGEVELLLAIGEHRGSVHVKYVYLGSSGKEPKIHEIFLSHT